VVTVFTKSSLHPPVNIFFLHLFSPTFCSYEHRFSTKFTIHMTSYICSWEKKYKQNAIFLYRKNVFNKTITLPWTYFTAVVTFLGRIVLFISEFIIRLILRTRTEYHSAYIKLNMPCFFYISKSRSCLGNKPACVRLSLLKSHCS